MIAFQTLGPVDYLALASTFHTVIIDDIPILTASMKDQARRFISLVDALYECRCRLICFAAAPPEALFFPVTVGTDGDSDGEGLDEVMMAEAISEGREAFRPNVSSYSELPNERSNTESQKTTALDLSSLSIFSGEG